MAVNIYRRLIVDRIRFSILTPDSVYGFVWSQLKEMSEMTKHGDIFPGWKLPISKKEYGKTRLWFRPKAKRTIAMIEIGTSYEKKKYLRLDLTPSKFRPGEFACLKEVLAHFLEFVDYEKLFNSASVSYLELAFDSLTYPKQSFIPFRTRTFVSEVFAKNVDKGSTYVGSAKGRLRFCIYDKRKQILEKLKKIPEHNIQTRIEARIRSTGLTAAKLHVGLKNPFKKLEMADPVKLKAILKHPDLPAFLDECHKSGSCLALGKLSVKDRRIYLKALRLAKCSWWKPDWIWNQLPDALAVIAP